MSVCDCDCNCDGQNHKFHTKDEFGMSLLIEKKLQGIHATE